MTGGSPSQMRTSFVTYEAYVIAKSRHPYYKSSKLPQELGLRKDGSDAPSLSEAPELHNSPSRLSQHCPRTVNSSSAKISISSKDENRKQTSKRQRVSKDITLPLGDNFEGNSTAGFSPVNDFSVTPDCSLLPTVQGAYGDGSLSLQASETYYSSLSHISDSVFASSPPANASDCVKNGRTDTRNAHSFKSRRRAGRKDLMADLPVYISSFSSNETNDPIEYTQVNSHALTLGQTKKACSYEGEYPVTVRTKPKAVRVRRFPVRYTDNDTRFAWPLGLRKNQARLLEFSKGDGFISHERALPPHLTARKPLNINTTGFEVRPAFPQPLGTTKSNTSVKTHHDDSRGRCTTIDDNTTLSDTADTELMQSICKTDSDSSGGGSKDDTCFPPSQRYPSNSSHPLPQKEPTTNSLSSDSPNLFASLPIEANTLASMESNEEAAHPDEIVGLQANLPRILPYDIEDRSPNNHENAVGIESNSDVPMPGSTGISRLKAAESTFTVKKEHLHRENSQEKAAGMASADILPSTMCNPPSSRGQTTHNKPNCGLSKVVAVSDIPGLHGDSRLFHTANGSPLKGRGVQRMPVAANLGGSYTQ